MTDSETHINRKMPGATIRAITYAGVSEDRTEAVVIITTNEQGDVALKIPFLPLDALIAALLDIKKRVKGEGIATTENVEATVVQTYAIGHVKDRKGVLLVISPDTEAQEGYFFNAQSAIECGRKLMQRGAAMSERPKASSVIHNRNAGKLFGPNGKPIDPSKQH